MAHPDARYAGKMPATQVLDPWFLAHPEKLPSFRMQPRDGLLLEGLARFGEATSQQLARFVGSSPRAVARRCYLLYVYGYLTRPPTQLSYLATSRYAGAMPYVLSLSRLGARYLGETGVSLTHLIDWTFRPPSPAQLPHTLAVTDIILSLQEAAASRGLALSDHLDLLPTFPEATRESKRPFHLSVMINEQGRTVRRAVRPDRICTLELPDHTRLPYFIELDRGTESLRTKIAHKITTYRHAFLQDRHRELFNFTRGRVLTITTSDVRVQHMLELQERLTGGHAKSLFLYTTFERLAAHGILGPAWRGADVDGLTILPQPTAPANAR